MTLTMGFVTDKFILFAADKRRTNMIDNSIFYDDMEKLYKVNNRVFILFSGDMKVTISCREYLQGKPLENATVQAVSVIVRRFLMELLKGKSDMEQDIIIGGVGDGDKIMTVSMSHRENYKLEKVIPEQGELRWVTNFADVSPHDHIQATVSELIENDEVLTIDKVKEIATESIQKVSESDVYVSATYDLDYITL